MIKFNGVWVMLSQIQYLMKTPAYNHTELFLVGGKSIIVTFTPEEAANMILDAMEKQRVN